MTDPDVMRQAGEKLRKLRLRLGLSIREVERLSLKVVEEHENPDYHLSRNWIASVEKGRFFPGTFKNYSLGLILGTDPAEIHSLYGFKPGDITKEIGLFRAPKTHLIAAAGEPLAETATPYTSSNAMSEPENASRMTSLVEICGEVPVPELSRHLRRCLYGFIGMKDETMSPILPPGTLVRIDVKQTHVSNDEFHKSAVRSAYARPIYFLDIRSGYACGWCQIENSVLTLIPHPYSGVKTRTFRHPSEVEVVGRVTWIGLSIGNEVPPELDESLRRKSSGKK